MAGMCHLGFEGEEGRRDINAGSDIKHNLGLESACRGYQRGGPPDLRARKEAYKCGGQ